MDKSYMLNSYISDESKSLNALDQANNNKEQYYFRTTGVKTLEELKKEVAIFLEKNEVPIELREKLVATINGFNENTNLYQASIYLDDIINNYQKEAENNYKKNSEQVTEIKTDLVNQVKSDLDGIGISLEGDPTLTLDSINSERDVYKIKENTDRVVDYYQDKPVDNDSPTIMLSMEDINKAVDKPNDETLLNESIDQEMKPVNQTPSIDMKDDGSITLEGNANNPESMNFTAMMTLALVVGNNNLNLGENRDIKFNKEIRETNNYQVEFGNYSTHTNKFDPVLLQKVQQLASSYNPSVSYINTLSTYSTEMFLAFQIVNNYILKQPGSFKMAIKNNNGNYNMKFGFSSDYQEVVDAFIENGAYMTEDINHDPVSIINDNGNKEQLMQLGQILDGLETKEKEKNQVEQLQNQYQKKLIYPVNNNAANISQIFLMTVLIADLFLVLISIYFFFF